MNSPDGLLAGDPGLEPGLTESESVVLPIKLIPKMAVGLLAI